MPTDKKQVFGRLTENGEILLNKLRDKLGLSISGTIELAIRRLAELEGVTADSPTPSEKPRQE